MLLCANFCTKLVLAGGFVRPCGSKKSEKKQGSPWSCRKIEQLGLALKTSLGFGFCGGNLFVIIRLPLYNAARLAGRVALFYLFLILNVTLTLKPARNGLKGDLDREQEKTCQPRYIDYQTPHYCLRIHPSSHIWCFLICWCCCSLVDVGRKPWFTGRLWCSFKSRCSACI